MSDQHSSLDPIPRIRGTHARVDLSALRNNFQTLRERLGTREILCVIKADAYGLGAVPVARALEPHDVAMFGVALVEEGLALRRGGVRKPVLVLGGTLGGGYREMVAHDLTPVVFTREHVQSLSSAAGGRTIPVHLKVDTGMNRLGVAVDELDSFLDALVAARNLQVDGFMSHLANADEPGHPLNERQVERFRAALSRLEARGIRPRRIHLSNSAGTLTRPSLGETMVRPGLLLYGLSPMGPGRMEEGLRPVLTWCAQVVQVRDIPAGTDVSYGGVWTSQRASRIATVSVGYADGYPRLLSNKGVMLVRGKRAPVVGRVCMDLCMLDVTEIPEVRAGDEVVILGSQGGQHISAHEVAEMASTIPWEILCGISSRVPREYTP
ncbi:MAG: alanine racemase [Myxococcota bacterium]